jgi:hypothetical protein
VNRDQFPDWADRIQYWDVHDLDVATADQALPEIHQRVRALAADLAAFERVGTAGWWRPAHRDML